MAHTSPCSLCSYTLCHSTTSFFYFYPGMERCGRRPGHLHPSKSFLAESATSWGPCVRLLRISSVTWSLRWMSVATCLIFHQRSTNGHFKVTIRYGYHCINVRSLYTDKYFSQLMTIFTHFDVEYHMRSLLTHGFQCLSRHSNKKGGKQIFKNMRGVGGDWR